MPGPDRPLVGHTTPFITAGSPRARTDDVPGPGPPRHVLRVLGTPLTRRSSIEAANALLEDFDEASRLRSQLGEDALPADQRIQWMERLASARKTAQDSATVLSQGEALILQV